jgi:death on curing protein
MPIYLTAEQVLFMHARLIAETGGAHGVRDLGLLLSAIARPQATFDSQELFPDLFTKAAALFESLIGNHPFVDGNKRTAIISASLFLRINNVRLVADNEGLVEFTLQCAQGFISFKLMVAWFEENSET